MIVVLADESATPVPNAGELSAVWVVGVVVALVLGGLIAAAAVWWRSRRHQRVRWRIALWVLTAMVAGAAAVARAGELDAAWQVTLATAAALCGVAAEFGPRVLDRLRDVQREGEEMRARLSGVTEGELERSLGELDPIALGGWRSTLADDVIVDGVRRPYVPRQVDTDLRAALQVASAVDSTQLVVLCGPPKAGKTRTLYEAAKRTLADRKTLIVRQPQVGDAAASRPLEILAACADAVSSPSGDLLIWVDDAHEHLHRGLATSTLDELDRAFPGAVILMTMHVHALDDLNPALGTPMPGASKADNQHAGIRDRKLYQRLEKATSGLRLETELIDTELPAATRMYGAVIEEAQAGSVRHLANALAGVDIQRERLRSAFSHPDKVLGALVVQSAMRWRLGGMPPAMPLADLRSFTEQSALRELKPPRTVDDAKWNDALAWADNIEHGSSLLLPEDAPDRRRCFDGILDQGRPPHDQWQWDFILDRVTVESADAVGFAAYNAHWPQVATSVDYRIRRAS